MNEHERGQVAATAAEIYEEFFVPALFAEWLARVLNAANVQAGDAVLDVACGTGVLARQAARWVGAGDRCGYQQGDACRGPEEGTGTFLESRSGGIIALRGRKL